VGSESRSIDAEREIHVRGNACGWRCGICTRAVVPALLVALLLADCSDDHATKPEPSPPRVFVVHPDGSGECPTIADALERAASGDTIELACGLFKGEGNRDLDFHGKNVTVRSAGCGPSACVIDCEGSEADPYWGFAFHSGEGPQAVLQNLAIRGGYRVGGGGAIACDSSSSPALINIVMIGNRNRALMCRSSSPALTNCTFFDNPEGAMACWNRASPKLTSCQFLGNSATYSGGAIDCNSSTVTLTYCSLHQNSAAFAGGAIAAWRIEAEPCSVLVFSCFFQDNSAEYHGGAIACSASHLELGACVFQDNLAAVNGGGLWCSHGTSPTIDHCTFVGNTAQSGGGIKCEWAASPIVTNTILAFHSGGGALECDHLLGECLPYLTLCDLFGNTGGDWTGCIAEQAAIRGNIWADPLFCDAEHGNLFLQHGSPCADIEGETIGAKPADCE